VTISGCTFESIHNAIGVKVTTSTGGIIENILIDDCDISRCVWGIDVTPRSDGTELRNIVISNNRIGNFSEYDSGSWQGFGEKPHTDYIFCRFNYQSLWDPVKIIGNSFYQDNDPPGSGGTAAVYCSAGAPAWIFNNIFWKTPMTRTLEISPLNKGAELQEVRVYNNLFYQGGIQILMDDELDINKRKMYIQNNIFVRDAAANSLSIARNRATVMPVVLNNNLYFSNIYTETEKQHFKLNFTGNKFIDAQNAGYELNGDWGNPLFGNVIGEFSGLNLRLGAGSAGIGLGANLSAYFTMDKDGNARPASGAWDVGPYVYDASPPVADTTPPTLISASIGFTGGAGTLVFDEPVQGVNLSHYSLSTGATLDDLAGSGTTWTFSISPVVQQGQTVTISYTSGAGRTRDLADNLLATIIDDEITNNSLEETPDPPRAPRKGRGVGGQNRPFGR
jgi:hypothetical protein